MPHDFLTPTGFSGFSNFLIRDIALSSHRKDCLPYRISVVQRPRSTAMIMIAPLWLFFLLGIFAAHGNAQTCIPGQFVSESGCMPCQKQRISMIANAIECVRCEDGTIPTKARSRCVPCPIGRFFIRGSLSPCRRCPIDTFSTEPMSFSCETCPKGTISTKESKNLEECITCPIGTVVFRSRSLKRIRCNECPRGTTTFTTNAPECLPCPKGQFRFRSGFRLRELIPPVSGRTPLRTFFCKICPAGTFTDKEGADRCTKCPSGTFQNELGATSCKPCPPGSESLGTGSRECRASCGRKEPGCNSCKPGFQFNAMTEKCEQCPPGTVSTVRSSTPCHPCPPGESGVNADRTRCVCSDTESLRNDGMCVPCRSDFVSLNGRECTCGIEGATSSCICPPRTKREGNRCEPCDPTKDQLCERCDLGEFTTFMEGINVCERCAPGTFNARENADSCRPCPPGKTTVQFEDMSKCGCIAGLGLRRGKCEPCPPGTFSENGQNSCTKCFSRSFNDEPGASVCKRCDSARKRGATSCSM